MPALMTTLPVTAIAFFSYYGYYAHIFQQHYGGLYQCHAVVRK